jgi:hypothetical protein
LELKDWLGDDMFDHVRAFHRPRTVKETIGLLQQRNGQACLVAGGTDLALRAGRSLTTLVDIGGLGLDYIKRHDGGLRIGAACTMSALDESSLIQRFANGVLAQAAACCGTIQTRNVATIGGNLANASPAADTATPLLALDAQVVLHGAKGKRRVAIADFFLAPHQTVANSSLLTEIVVPAHKPRTAWAFQRFSRTEVDVQYRPQRMNRRDGTPIKGEHLERQGQSPIDAAHVKNFFECVESGKEPNCPFDLGFRVAIASRMVVDSYRQERMVRWDPVKEEIV